MSIPYETATSGDRAILEIQKILAKFNCTTFGHMIDTERGLTIVQFRWRNREVSLEASWRGYATAWLKAHPWAYRMRRTRKEHEDYALAQAKISVCSILRDWVKAQVMMVESGIMSFEAVFIPHMLLPTGERVIDRVASEILALPEPART